MSLHELLVRWKNYNYISDMTYKRLNCTDGVLPRAYGLLKIHKPNCPFKVHCLLNQHPPTLISRIFT